MDALGLPVSLDEARLALLDHAKRRFGKLDPAPLVEHVLTVTAGADWPVRLGALEALVRRHGFATRDGLRVLARPAGGGALGRWKIGRAKGAERGRSYQLELGSLEPLYTSCGCADFVRSSLGLCKHGLVALIAVGDRARARARAQRVRAVPAGGRLSWDPVHPLRGPADRASRLRVVGTNALRFVGVAGGVLPSEALARPNARLLLLRALDHACERGTLAAEPGARTVLAEELARADRALVAERSLVACKRALRTLGRRLYPYQREGVTRFLRDGRLLLADDMGLGKTTQAIACCHALYGAKQVRRGLLVVPSSLKPQWAREWSATTSVPLAPVDGPPAERARVYGRTVKGFLVIGYEQLLRDLAHVQRFAPEIVVLDEAQRIKNWATKSAAYVKSLSPQYRLVLTGTPMENRLDELASIVDFVDDVALEPKWRLAPWHSFSSGDGATGSSGARNLDALRARLAPVMLRRVRNEVLAQLPARTDTRVPIELTDAQRLEHDDLDRPIASLMSRAARRPLTQGEFLKLMTLLAHQRMICNGLAQVHFDDAWPRCERARATPALLDSLFAPKLGAVRTLVADLCVTQRRKVVAFSQWRRMVRLSEWAVRDVLAEAGLRAMFFTGAESPKQRERAIVDFHDDPGVALLFLTDAGGVGLNLQRAASACIQLELPWNPAVLEQRIGRIHRLGQTRPIDVFHLVSEQGIESRIATLIGKKRAVFSSLFDGTTDEVRFDGSASFLDTVRAIVDAPVVPGVDAAEPEAIEPVAEPGDGASIELADGEGAQLATAGAQASVPLPTLAASAPEHASSRASFGPTAAPFRVVRRDDGGLSIDVPPVLAEPLAALLSSLAEALRASPPAG